ncbi:MAG TPA: UDP-glucose/GDP-mannose dehydrogenase family protein [Bacillota bacterium]|nr:UDP-glucose/GDP-mannose dehydrogenase family protein [Bacillota bacterium]
MDIAVLGTGYVGLVTGVCLADLGHHVTCIDIDHDKIATLKKGTSPIYEEGLTELLQKNLHNGNVRFTTDYAEGLSGKKLIYIAVGTPRSDDGSADLTYIDEAITSIAKHVVDDVIIVTKSTVPVGANEYIQEKIQANVVKDVTISIVSNPEFLRQGSAVYDTFHGDRIVIGSDDEKALDILEEVNAGFQCPIVRTDLRSAEMIKYASNAFLATKITFINEVANLSEKIGANIDDVAKGMGMDERIGPHFLNAGVGYGGSCFPKDTRALLSIAKRENSPMPILENVIAANERQKRIIIDKLLQRFGDLQGKNVAVLGLAFKPNTDDMREAPSILITNELIERGASVSAFDPVATVNAKKILPEAIDYATTIDEAIRDKDVAIILTEWDDIKRYPLKNYVSDMARPVIFDGRNCLSLKDARESGIEYHSIGRPTVHYPN